MLNDKLRTSFSGAFPPRSKDVLNRCLELVCMSVCRVRALCVRVCVRVGGGGACVRACMREYVRV